MSAAGQGRAEVEDARERLARLRRGPSSRRLTEATPFERGLLQVWSDAKTRSHPLLSRWLSADQCAALDQARRRHAQTERTEEASRFLANVFQVLPKPVLFHGPEGTVGNTAFERELAVETRDPGVTRGEVLARFLSILEHGAALKVPRLLVALGGRVWSLQREDFPGGTALYFSELAVALPAGPPVACAVALLKASGLAHKQIAALCGRNKFQIDRIASRQKRAVAHLRASLCHVSLR